jgi:hypothetical protein
MPTPKLTTFHVALDQIKLSTAQKSDLTKAVNGATLEQLARLDLADDVNVLLPKIKWMGIWIGDNRLGIKTPGVAPQKPAAIDKATVASVVLEGVKLTSKQRTAVDVAIREAVIRQISGIGVKKGIGVRYPKEWQGIWIGPLGKNE